ncbi:hypothetical protein NP493_160g01007 [Ridgeia piscesae]|uniref:VWFC domain-containing protein n=1 Tax=Ridgeia piscesae TaxID=27915 RepID=A0AAD9P3S5_RIDPI|nr:hypothetical protein NP493_160g01007 [Ridgeia piscesae]
MTVASLTPTSSCFLRRRECDITVAGLSGSDGDQFAMLAKAARINNRLDCRDVITGAVTRVATCRANAGTNVIPAVPTAPPTPDSRHAVPAPVPAGACRHNGRVYRDSAEGSVLCHLKTCPRLKCAKTRHKKNDCCRQCSSPERKSSGVCRSGDERHKNGSTWHPVVHPFGRVRCVVCHCLNGRISCDRVQCGPGTRPACDGKTGNDQCCKRCRKQKERPDMTTERSDGGNSSSTPTTKLCMPRASDVIVSRYSARRQLTLIFANTRHRRADVLSWELHKGLMEQLRERKRERQSFFLPDRGRCGGRAAFSTPRLGARAGEE